MCQCGQGDPANSRGSLSRGVGEGTRTPPTLSPRLESSSLHGLCSICPGAKAGDSSGDSGRPRTISSLLLRPCPASRTLSEFSFSCPLTLNSLASAGS